MNAGSPRSVAAVSKFIMALILVPSSDKESKLVPVSDVPLKATP